MMLPLVLSLWLYGCQALGSVSNAECMEVNCRQEWEACKDDAMCLECESCSAYCVDNWDSDPTPQKVHAQNCTLKCSESYADKVENDYAACMFGNNCITLPPINVTCPATQLAKSVEANSSLHDLSGYPCHHIHSMEIYNKSSWAYTYSYEVYLVNNSLQTYEDTLMLPYSDEVGVPMNFSYEYLGTPHEETWYILASTERYVVLGACSYILTWTNVASIVWVRPNISLTPSEMTDIANIYAQSTGWDFPNEFCEVKHGDDVCPNPDKKK